MRVLKIPQTSHQISRQISLPQKKKSPTSFCRGAGRTISYEVRPAALERSLEELELKIPVFERVFLARESSGTYPIKFPSTLGRASPKRLLPMVRRQSETGIGGVKTYRAPEKGGTRPESCPWKAWTFDPQIEDFLLNLCRKGSNSRPPIIFGDLTPPIPVSKTKSRAVLGDFDKKRRKPPFWHLSGPTF